MNPHIELVKKWLADSDSVSLEELKENKKAAWDASIYAASSAIGYAAYAAADSAYGAAADSAYGAADAADAVDAAAAASERSTSGGPGQRAVLLLVMPGQCFCGG